MAKLFYHDNIVKIVHEGKGDKANAESIIARSRPLMLAVKGNHARMAAYHDLSALTSPDDDYIRLWAAIGKELQEGSFYLVYVPNAWVRVAAKTAAFIGRFKLEFSGSEAEALGILNKNGFAAGPQTPWIPR